MASTDPAGDETCPERRRAEMPIAFTPTSPFVPLRPRENIAVAPGQPSVAKLPRLALPSHPERISPAMR